MKSLLSHVSVSSAIDESDPAATWLQSQVVVECGLCRANLALPSSAPPVAKKQCGVCKCAACGASSKEPSSHVHLEQRLPIQLFMWELASWPGRGEEGTPTGGRQRVTAPHTMFPAQQVLQVRTFLGRARKTLSGEQAAPVGGSLGVWS